MISRFVFFLLLALFLLVGLAWLQRNNRVWINSLAQTKPLPRMHKYWRIVFAVFLLPLLLLPVALLSHSSANLLLPVLALVSGWVVLLLTRLIASDDLLPGLFASLLSGQMVLMIFGAGELRLSPYLLPLYVVAWICLAVAGLALTYSNVFEHDFLLFRLGVRRRALIALCSLSFGLVAASFGAWPMIRVLMIASAGGVTAAFAVAAFCGSDDYNSRVPRYITCMFTLSLLLSVAHMFMVTAS